MKRALILISAIFIAIINVNGQKADTKIEENPNAPELTFEKIVHNYGTIYKGSDGVCEFHFTNTGKEPLIIDKPRSSCGCTVPTWPKQPILPGKGDMIKVTYDTKRMGRIHKTVSIKSNAKNNPVVLTIKGNVVAKPKEELPEKNLDDSGSPVNK